MLACDLQRLNCDKLYQNTLRAPTLAVLEIWIFHGEFPKNPGRFREEEQTTEEKEKKQKEEQGTA
jgi:hypothetical protein